MTDSVWLNHSIRYRKLAEELYALAEDTHNEHCRRTRETLAADYVWLAHIAEQRHNEEQNKLTRRA